MAEERAEFRGRTVYTAGDPEYPVVYWPEHPTSNVAGLAYVHRVVAYEVWGEDVEGQHVHHRDGDPENWQPENLELLEPAEHARHHRAGEQVRLTCDTCGREFDRSASQVRSDRVYCSNGCRGRAQERIDWPPVEELQRRAKETSFLALSRELGVSDNAIRKRISNHD